VTDLKAILDSTALHAFVARGIDVGETIAEIVDEGGRFGIPVTVLADVLRRMDDGPARHVNVLVTNPGCVILDVEARDVDAIAWWGRIAHGTERGVCVVAALSQDGCLILTADPDAYGPKLEDLVVGV
jgi:rRNA-processing protein FCF1